MLYRSCLGLLAAATFSSGVAANPQLCKSMQVSASGDIFALYYKLASKTPWIFVPDLRSGKAIALAPRSTDFAVVVTPLTERSGVLSMRVRTQAVGPQPDAARVRLDRGAVDEPCGIGGRYYRLRKFNNTIPTKIYEEYHGSPPVDNSELDTFHFSYKPDQGSCVATNDADRRGSFRFSAIQPQTLGGPQVARAVHPPELNTRFAYISQGIARAFAAFEPNQRNNETAGSAPLPTHYTKLVSVLQKYDGRKIGQDCIEFTVSPSAGEVHTYVSITDFSEPSIFSSFSDVNWQIDWQGH